MILGTKIRSDTSHWGLSPQFTGIGGFQFSIQRDKKVKGGYKEGYLDPSLLTPFTDVALTMISVIQTFSLMKQSCEA